MVVPASPSICRNVVHYPISDPAPSVTGWPVVIQPTRRRETGPAPHREDSEAQCDQDKANHVIALETAPVH